MAAVHPSPLFANLLLLSQPLAGLAEGTQRCYSQQSPST